MALRIRPLRFDGDLAFIPLTRGYEAVIDAADAHLVEGRNWHATRSRNTHYAQCLAPAPTGHPRASRSLHQFILPLSDGMYVDHIDGNGLNNRRSNLRPATHAENCRNRRTGINNTSGYRGVSFNRGKGRWSARIHNSGKTIHVGYFRSKEEAHEAYVAASLRLWGEFGGVR